MQDKNTICTPTILPKYEHNQFFISRLLLCIIFL